MASSFITEDRLLKLFTASPQYASMAAKRLAILAGKLSNAEEEFEIKEEEGNKEGLTKSSPQIDLLWRIASYLFHKKWETRVAASLALKEVGQVIKQSDLAYCLFGTTGMSPGSHPGITKGLFSLQTLDIEMVLNDGEPLLASSGEEYQHEQSQQRISREELERQKFEIFKRLGLETEDADARKAWEVGGGRHLTLFDIQDEDLVVLDSEGKEGKRKNQSQANGRNMKGRETRKRPKRKVEELNLETSEGEGEMGKCDKKSNAVLSAKQPWLSEHFSVRLFDAAWESRHGAILGLMALFKAWMEVSGGQCKMTKWQDRWVEDIVGRCLCILALDRFGDYSQGTAVVAPIRETSAQLLALILALTSSPGQLTGQCISQLQTICQKKKVTWEVRHAAYLGVKYLVAVPSPAVVSALPQLSGLATEGLTDANEDVRAAAATSILSLVYCQTPESNTQQLKSVLRPVLMTLNRADESALYLVTYLQIAIEEFDIILGRRTHDLPSLLPLEFWSEATDSGKCHRKRGRKGRDDQESSSSVSFTCLLEHLWALGSCSEKDVRISALHLLNRALGYWSCVLDMSNDDDEQGGGEEILKVKDGKKKSAIIRKRGPPRKQETTSKVALAPVTQSIFTLAWKVMRDLAEPFLSCVERSQLLLDVWKTLVAVLLKMHQQESQRSSSISSFCSTLMQAWFGGEETSTDNTSSLEHRSWESRQRTSEAFSFLLVSSDNMDMALQKILPILETSDLLLESREICALLLGDMMMRLVQEGNEKKTGRRRSSMDQTMKDLLSANIVEGLKIHVGEEGEEDDDPLYAVKGRRLAVCAARAFVLGGGMEEDTDADRPGPLVRALMEAIKGEEEKARQNMAIECLVQTLAMLLQRGRAQKMTHKVVNNLCVFACTTKDEEMKLARTSSREVLKRLVLCLGANVFELLPGLRSSIWDGIICCPRRSDGKEEEEVAADAVVVHPSAVEEGIRLLMVITPFLDEQCMDCFDQVFLESLLSRATADYEGQLVNLLASRCLSNLLKRTTKDAGRLVGHLITPMNRILRDRGNERDRPHLAHVLLELSKTVRDMPSEDITPPLLYLLPIAMATAADDNVEVRTPGGEAFRLLVELSPLLGEEEWSHCRQRSDGKEEVDDVMAREAIMRMVLGEENERNKDPLPLPPSLTSFFRSGLTLRPYQWEGVRWLTLLRRAGLHGALCDEMGLGKTLQSLVSLAVAHCEEDLSSSRSSSSSRTKPSLVLCPASITGHWYSEAERFFDPQVLEPILYRAGLSTQEKIGLLEGAQQGRHVLMIASYDMLRRDVDLLTKQPWEHILFDEIHVLRGGEKTVLGQAVRRLRGSHRIALTGTPLQNQIHDVWAVFDVLMPGLLGKRCDFEKEFGRPIGRATLRTASANATAEALLQLERLHAHLLPFLLRREKSTVLKDLPPKTITDLICELAPLQREMYDKYCQSSQTQNVLETLRNFVEGGNNNNNKNLVTRDLREGMRTEVGGKALRLLHYLRLLCVHPALIITGKSPEMATARDQLLSDVESSAKMMALENLLCSCGVLMDEGKEEEMMTDDDRMETAVEEEEEQEEEKGQKENEEVLPRVESPNLHRCLIFAQHRDTLDAIERSILNQARWNEDYGRSATTNGVTRYLRLDGLVPSHQREALVTRFNSDPSIPIMLLTTRVGGLGLNLTGADVVIFVEHDWNPAVDLQAMDRAHRIGQGRPVNVYRLITRNTIEEQIMALQHRKRELADAVVTESNERANDINVMTSVVELLTATAQEINKSKGLDTATNEGVFANQTEVGDLAISVEEPWNEEQYSSFAIQSFLTDVLGLKNREEMKDY